MMKYKLYPLWIGTEVRIIPNPYLPTWQGVGTDGTGCIYTAVPSVPTCPASCPEPKNDMTQAMSRTFLPLHTSSVPIRTIRTYSTIGGIRLWQI